MLRSIFLLVALLTTGSSHAGSHLRSSISTTRARGCHLPKELGFSKDWLFGFDSMLSIDMPAPHCFGSILLPIDYGHIDHVNALDVVDVRQEAAQVVVLYDARLIEASRLKEKHDRFEATNFIGQVACSRYPEKLGNTTRVYFMPGLMRELGGPAYPRLLLERAVELEDVEATETLVQLMRRASGFRTCEYARQQVFADHYRELLESDLDAADRFDAEFAFMHDGMLKTRAIWEFNSDETLVGNYLHDLFQDEDYGRALEVGRHYGVPEYVHGLAYLRLIEAYRDDFVLQERVEFEPLEVQQLDQLFGFSDEEKRQAQIEGLALGAPEPYYVLVNGVDPRLDELPLASRTIVVKRELDKYHGVGLHNLKQVHAYMQLAEVDPGEVMPEIVSALRDSARYAYLDSIGGGYQTWIHWRSTLAVGYAIDELGLEPAHDVPYDCALGEPNRNSPLVGDWYLACNPGAVNFIDRVEEIVRRRGLDRGE